MGMSNKKGRKTNQVDYRKIAEGVKYGAIEAFSGPGGIGLGLKNAGFSILLSFDNDSQAVETHNANLEDKCIMLDAKIADGYSLLKEAEFSGKDLPLFAGGPPCQGFSKQKRGAHNGDARNDLILEYIRLVNEIKPRFFLFENVKIFGQKRGKTYLDRMFREFQDYKLYPHFYNSADYGLAQTRERFIMVGRRLDQQATFQIPHPTVRKWRTVGDVLKGLPEPPDDFSEHPSYPNHQRAKVTEMNLKRFSYVPEGGGWQDIPFDLRLDCHKGVSIKSGGWPDVYGRLEWSGQCPTITGGFDSFTRGRYGHPKSNRPITPREAARLQGFPDSYVFKGTRDDIRSQIGNAVPPPLAEAVGREILRSLLCADGYIEDSGVEKEYYDQLALLA